MQFAKWTELSFLLSVHISKANIAWRRVSTESVQYIFLSELNDACHSSCCLSEPMEILCKSQDCATSMKEGSIVSCSDIHIDTQN